MTNSELKNKSMKDRMELFDKVIKMKMGDSMGVPDQKKSESNKYSEEHTGEKEFVPYDELYEEGTLVLVNDDEYMDHDLMVNTKVILPQVGEHTRAARVLGRAKNDKGTCIGAYDKNPILDTRVFNVEFLD